MRDKNHHWVSLSLKEFRLSTWWILFDKRIKRCVVSRGSGWGSHGLLKRQSISYPHLLSPPCSVSSTWLKWKTQVSHSTQIVSFKLQRETATSLHWKNWAFGRKEITKGHFHYRLLNNEAMKYEQDMWPFPSFIRSSNAAVIQPLAQRSKGWILWWHHAISFSPLFSNGLIKYLIFKLCQEPEKN